MRPPGLFSPGPALMPPRLAVCTGPRPRHRCPSGCQGLQRGGGGGKVFRGRTKTRRKGAKSGGRPRGPSARRCHPAPNRRAQRRQHVRAAGARPGAAGGGDEPGQPPSSAPGCGAGGTGPKTEKGRPPGLAPTVIAPARRPAPGRVSRPRGPPVQPRTTPVRRTRRARAGRFGLQKQRTSPVLLLSRRAGRPHR